MKKLTCKQVRKKTVSARKAVKIDSQTTDLIDSRINDAANKGMESIRINTERIGWIKRNILGMISDECWNDWWNKYRSLSKQYKDRGFSVSAGSGSDIIISWQDHIKHTYFKENKKESKKTNTRSIHVHVDNNDTSDFRYEGPMG